MLREFKLPDVGEGLTEAEIVRWHVAPGDSVRINQTIVEIETAKAVVELPCPFEGVVGSLLAAEGETVDVGVPIITVETGPGAAPSSNGTGGSASERGPEPAPEQAPVRAPGQPPDRAAAERAVPQPPAEGAVEPGVEGSPAPKQERQPVLVGYGVKLGTAKRRPRRAGPGRGPAGTSPAAPSFPGSPAAAVPGSAAPPEALASPGTSAGTGATGAPGSAGSALTGEPSGDATAPGGHRVTVLAKPPVRKLAKDLGVDLTKISGTGPQGSITRQDVHQAAEAAPVPAAPAAPGREERIPVKGVRRAMASAMVASAFSVPHVTEFLQVDVTATVDAVARLRAMPDFAEVKVSPLLLAARALLVAAKRHPLINSSWDGDAVVVKHYVNLGIAAATERGLIVPNVKDAHALSLPALAAALSELTARARAGRTQPAEMSGGTITITNVGVFGVDTGTPIINPGEAAILAFGQIRDLPWVVDGAIVPRKVCTLALSFDHRIVDGELGSYVLRDVGAMLEDPLRLLAWS